MTKHYNIEMEKSVLASLMSIENSYIHIANIIQSSDFYSQRHQDIFRLLTYRTVTNLMTL